MGEIYQEIKSANGGYRLIQHQHIDTDINSAFEFFSNPHNLEELTPDRLHFNVLNCEPDPVEEGTRINYKLRIWGVPIRWTSEITHWDPPQEFRDVMKKGPYKTWEHTHRFEENSGGTDVIDEVYFELPLGILGRWFGGWAVKRDLRSIFRHRSEQLDNFFTS